MKTFSLTLIALMIVILQAVPAMGQRSTSDQQTLIQQRIQRLTTAYDFLQKRVDRVREALKDVPRENVAPLKARYENFIVEMRALKLELDQVTASNDFIGVNLVLDRIAIKIGSFSEGLALVEQRIIAFRQEHRLQLANVEKAVERTDKAIARAVQIVKKTDKGEEAFPGLRRAASIQEDAKQKLSAKELRAAMALTLKAREILENTIKSALDAEDIKELVERAVTFWENTNRIIERIESELDLLDHNKAAALIAKAKELQAEAKELAANNKARMAMNSSIRARRIVQGLIKIHNKAGNVENELARAESRLEHAEAIVDESENKRALTILENGRKQIEEAKQLILQGKNENATVKIVAGLKLIAKAVDVAER